jgi:hypothetical protein
LLLESGLVLPRLRRRSPSRPRGRRCYRSRPPAKSALCRPCRWGNCAVQSRTQEPGYLLSSC